MTAPAPTVLFDFFGTLVHYSASRTEQGYHRTLAVLHETGVDLSYQGFLDAWSRASEVHDRLTEADDSEYSMDDVLHTFAGQVASERLLTDPQAQQAVVDTYLAEWSSPVRPVDGLDALLDAVSRTHRTAVVTNTHHVPFVPDLLARFGLADRFEAVVTSVGVGRRKPHPAVYRAALDALGVRAQDCVFVGDTLLPDYVGPRREGMTAFLLDPDGVHDVPAEHRLATLPDLLDRLS